MFQKKCLSQLMTYKQYFSNILKLYEEIYNSLFFSLNKENNDNIISKCNRFRREESKFLEMLDINVNQSIDYEHDEWKEYLKINGNNNHFTLKISFFIDSPVLNEYGVIIEEKGHCQHHTFKQNQYESTTNNIRLASNLCILFDDDLIDKMRIGVLSSSCRIKLRYDVVNCPLIHLPFNNERIYLDDKLWVIETLNVMDNEIKSVINKLSIRKNRLRPTHTNFRRTNVLYE